MEYSLKMLISKTDFENLTLRQQWLNKQFNYKSKSLFKYKSLYDQLNEFDQIVESLKQNKNININIRNSFTSLRDKLVEEIYSHQPCQDYDTCYPTILEHFSDLADVINQGYSISIDQLSYSIWKIKNLERQEPMSKPIFETVFCLFAILLGMSLCGLGMFVGLSMAPLAILGLGWAGSFLLCAGMSGTAMIGTILTTVFKGQAIIDSLTKNRYQMFYQHKEKDANGVKTEMENVFNSLKDECDVHLDSLASKVGILCN